MNVHVHHRKAKSTKHSTKGKNTGTAPAPRSKHRKPSVVQRMPMVSAIATDATASAVTTPLADSVLKPPIGAPPAVTIPSIPTGFVPVNPADLKGYSPMQSEIAVVNDAVLELKSFTDYVAIFGVTAPDQTMLVQLLTIAAQWTGLLTASTNWLTYVKSESGLAWKDALVEMETLKAPFRLAVSRRPSIMSQFPSLARLLGAQKVVAKRAASARARGKKAAASTAAAETPAKNEAVTPAAPSVATTASTGPTVTVQA